MRAQILDTALTVIAAHGYSNATVKEIADAVGLSQNGILRYFGSKDALFVEVMQRNNATLTERVDPENTDFTVDLGERILDAVRDAMREAGLAQLLLRLSIEGSEADHVAHELIRDRYRRFREITSAALTAMQMRGDFSDRIDPDDAAAIIVSAMDGLQLQWLYDDSIDVTGRMAVLLRALGIPLAPDVEYEAGHDGQESASIR